MKKWISIILIAIILTACSPQSTPPQNNNTSSHIPPSSSSETSSDKDVSSDNSIALDEIIKRNGWDNATYSSLDELITQKELSDILAHDGISITLENNRIVYSDTVSNVKLILPPIKFSYQFEKLKSNPPQKLDYRKLNLTYSNPSTGNRNTIVLCSYQISFDPIKKAMDDNSGSNSPWDDMNLFEDFKRSDEKGFGGARKYLESDCKDKILFIYEIEGWNTFFQAEMDKESYQNGGKDLLLFLTENLYSIKSNVTP